MKKLLGILFLFITINASAQWNRDDTTRYIWYHYQYGTRMPRAIYDSVFAPPKDTVFSKKGLATKGSALYVGNGTYWTLSSVGGVGGLDSIRNNFNNTKIIIWAGGIAKDSLAKGIIKYQIANFKVTNISPGLDSVSYIGSGGGGASKYTTNQYGILVDSATANLYKIKADSTVLLSKLNANSTYYSSRTVAPDSSYVTFNRPDGTKDTLRFTGATAGGTITLTTTGTSGAATLVSNVLNIPQYSGGGTTSEQVLTATAAQTAFTFTSVPASYNDYMIIVNGGVGASTTAYTTSGNIVTTTLPLDAGDVVILRRIK